MIDSLKLVQEFIEETIIPQYDEFEAVSVEYRIWQKRQLLWQKKQGKQTGWQEYVLQKLIVWQKWCQSLWFK